MKTLLSKRPRWEPTEEQLQIIKAMLCAGKGQTEITGFLGVSMSVLSRVMKDHGLRYAGRRSLHSDPTPEEIEARTAEARKASLARKRLEESPKERPPRLPKVASIYVGNRYIPRNF